MSLGVRKQTIWVLTGSDTNKPIQSKMQARSLKFGILEEEGLYYLCSENKGAHQPLVTTKLFCTFVFAQAFCLFSYAVAQI